MNIIADAKSESRATMVDDTNRDQYQQPIPINPIYKPAFMAVYQQSKLKSMNVQVVHEMKAEEAERLSQQDVGVFTARFDQWTCTLNWTESKRENLPPDYIGVDYGDVSCGIIGPNLTIRTCWHCGMTGWKDAGRTQGCVQSSYYDTNTGIWISRHCPKCYNQDWWANTIEPSRFVQDCAASITDVTKKKKHWSAFGGTQMDQMIRGTG